jgi:8-oxo-dGTP diphosphatase
MPERADPALTVDVIIERAGGVVLVRRRYPPPGWAIPGGFVEPGEPPWRAAVREAREETGLDVELTELFHVYGDPARDARRHTVSVVYLGRALGSLAAGDDAAEARVFAPETPPSPLAFDHAVILADYLRYRRGGPRPPVQR